MNAFARRALLVGLWLKPRLKAAAVAGGRLLWRLVRELGANARVAGALLLAVLAGACRLAVAQALGIWRSLDAPPGEIAEQAGQPRVSASGPSAIVPRTDVLPATRVEAGGGPAHGISGNGDSHQMLQALLALGQQGVAVTTVLRDQRGVRVKGIVAGESTTRWYSFDECSQLRERNAVERPFVAVETEAEAVPGQPRRRVWPRIALVSVALVVAAILIARNLPADRLELTVVQPTSAYSDYGDVLWIAASGERYRVLMHDGEWVLGVADLPGPPRVARIAWFMQSSRVDIASDRPEAWKLTASWAGRLGGLVEELLR